MRRIVVHPGFHKTGTSTAQRILWHNRKLIWPVAALALADRVRPMLEAAKAYAEWRRPAALDAFRQEALAFFATLDLGERRGMILSAENLSGHPPGRAGVASYEEVAPALLAELRRAVLRTWPDAHLVFVIGTRRRDAWLSSAWWQILKQGRLTLDEAAFADRHRDGARLRRAMRAVADAVAPAPVREARLEEIAHYRLGPAAPILDALAIGDDRRAAFEPLPPQNARPDGYGVLAAQLLEINRSPLSDADAKRARRLAIDAFKAGLAG